MSAEWGSDAVFPAASNTLLGYYTLNPHLALYVNQSVPLEDIGWKADGHGGHQYGAYIFFSYITNHFMDKPFIGAMFNNPRVRSEPVALAYDMLAEAGHDMKEIFGDFAARTVNFDYANGAYYAQSEASSWRRLQNAIDGAVSRKFAARYDGGGTGGAWHSPSREVTPGSWAYNTYVVEVTEDKAYSFAFRSDEDNPDYEDYRISVVVRSGDEQDPIFTYYALNLKQDGPAGQYTGRLNEVPGKAGETMFLVVATTPEVFNGFDTYNFEYQIQAREPSSTDIISDVDAGDGIILHRNAPNPVNTYTRISFRLPYAAELRLELIDAVSGRRVATLAEGRHGAQIHNVEFRPRDLADGVYIYRLTVDGEYTAARSMLLCRH